MTQYDNLPVLAMRGNFFFPNIRAKVEVARDVSRNAIKYALDNGGKFFMVSQLDGVKSMPNSADDLYKVGVIAEIASVESATSEATVVVTRTLESAKIIHVLYRGIIFKFGFSYVFIDFGKFGDVLDCFFKPGAGFGIVLTSKIHSLDACENNFIAHGYINNLCRFQSTPQKWK